MNRIIATAFFLALPLAATAQDEDEDKGYLTRLIEDNLSGDERVVNIVGFEGALSSEASIQQLTVADSDGVWLTLEDVVLDWNRSALLRGRLDVEELSAALVRVDRAPLPSGAELPPAEAQPFSLPELPVSIELGTLAIERFELGEPFLGEEIAVSLGGTAALGDGEGSATVEANRVDGAQGRFLIDGAYTNENSVLSLVLELEEGPDGIAAKTLDLPGRPAVSLRLQGEDPLSDFEALLTIATDGEERLDGRFQLTQTEAGQQFALEAGGDVTPLFAPDYREFFGTDVALDVAGTILPEGGLNLPTLSIQSRKLNLEGEIRTSASGWPERIDLRGAIRDPEGDIVLLPISGPKTFVDNVTLSVQYDRSQSDRWTANIDLRAFDRPGLLIDAITLDGGGTIIAGDGAAVGSVTADLAYAATGVQLDDAAVSEALGNRIEGRIDLNYEEGDPINLRSFTLDGPGIELDATAAVDPDAGYRTEASVLLSVDALARFAALAGRDLSGGADITLLATLDPSVPSYDLLVTGETDDLGVGIAEIDPYIGGDGTLSLQAVRDMAGTRLEGLSIRTPLSDLSARAALTTTGSDAQFRLAVEDLSLAAPGLTGPGTITGEVAQGVDMVIDFDVNLDAPETDVTLTGTATPVEDGQIVQADIAAAIASLSRYNALTGQDLSGGIDLTGSGRIVTDGLLFDADLTGTTTDLETGIAQLDPLLRGTGNLTLSAARTGPESIAVDVLRFDAPAMNLDAAGAGGLTGPITARVDLRLTDIGDVAPGLSGPAQLNATADRGTDGATQIDADLRADQTEVSIDAVVTEALRISGDLSADIASLSPFQNLVGQPIAGGVDLAVSGYVDADLQSFDAAINAQTSDLRIGNPGIDDLLRGDGDFRINAVREDGETDVEADLQLAGASVLADVIVTDALRVTGDVSADIPSLAPLQTLVGQPIAGGLSLQASGFVEADLQNFDADLSAQTSDLRIGNEAVDTLLRGTGNLDVNAARQDGQITVRNLDAQTANLSVSGSLTANGGAGSGQFDARLRDIGLFTDALSGPVTANGTASVRGDGSYGIDIDATGPGGITASAAGSIAAGGNLNIDLNGSAPLGLANPFLEPRRLSGVANFDLGINGPPALSSVTGQITTNGARLAAPTLGQALEGIEASVRLDGSSAQVSASGQVQTGGTISVNGPVALTAGYNADLTARLDSIVLRDPNLYETIVDGQITVNGPLTNGARISGVINVGATEVQVPSSGIGALGDLPDVTHINPGADVRRTLARADAIGGGEEASGGGGGPGFPLDITVNAPSRIFVRGRGLDAELGGSLQLTGSTNNIIPIGQFELVRGRLDILQQRFELDEGSATLQGDFVPFLRLVAVTEAESGTVVRIIVEGPANEPEVRFESTPDLPQDEVLSQLIFGRSIADISPLQAVQLAAAVGTLAGRGGGGVIDDFRQGLGLDDFDVTTDEEGNAALRAGKYLSENVYTDVTINAEGETEINLNLDLTDEITAKGSVDADGETSIGVFFERDY